MGLFDEVRGGLRRLYHAREIEASLRLYKERTGQDAESRPAYADSGTFRSQVDRLFAAGSPAETDLLQAIAQAAVTACLSCKYYGPADCLSDVIDALEGWTFVTTEAGGEPPLAALDPRERRAKISAVTGAWLVPIKIATLEDVIAGYARRAGRSLPYAALGRLERRAARLFALIQQCEVVTTGQRLQHFIEDWLAGGASRRRFREPADGVAYAVECFEGDVFIEAMGALRVRAPHQPLRLSTVVPDNRAGYLEAVFDSLTASPVGEAAGRPEVPEGLATGAAAGAATVSSSSSPLSSDAAPASPPPRGGEEAPAPLSIELHCPKCGGPSSVDDETVSLVCEYCSSLLVIEAPEREEVYFQDSLLTTDEAVLETILAHRVASERAEIISRYRDSDGNPPAEWLVEMKLREYATRLRAQSRLLEARWVYAPYWHITGKIVQGVLGRANNGPKHVSVRAFAVEHTVPGYDTSAVDLRDRGLRLRRSKVKPLTVRTVTSAGPFLPWASIEERTYREVEKWCTRNLVPEVDPVRTHGEFLFGRRVLVYRPYCLAHVVADRGPELILMDGSFGTIAGYPGADEEHALLKDCVGDPLRSQEESYRKVAIVPARCPNCGFEQSFDRRLCVVICPSCQCGLEPRTSGIRLFSYDHAESDARSVEYLPFWRYGMRVQFPDGSSAADLPAYAAGLFGDRDRSCLPIEGSSLWVPAFRLLGTEVGDVAFAAVSRSIHRHPPEVREGRVPLGGTARFWGASLPEQEARRLGRAVLMGLHDTRSAARLTGVLMHGRVVLSTIELAAPRLVMVPFEGDDQALVIPGTDVRIPRLVLTGGPALEALRASVHREWARG